MSIGTRLRQGNKNGNEILKWYELHLIESIAKTYKTNKTNYTIMASINEMRNSQI